MAIRKPVHQALTPLQQYDLKIARSAVVRARKYFKTGQNDTGQKALAHASRFLRNFGKLY